MLEMIKNVYLIIIFYSGNIVEKEYFTFTIIRIVFLKKKKKKKNRKAESKAIKTKVSK